MTQITAYDKRDKVVYNFRTPDNLTQEEIDKDLADMCVDRNNNQVVINRE